MFTNTRRFKGTCGRSSFLLVAGATWWSLNRSSKSEEMTRLSGTYEASEADSEWKVPKSMIKVLGMMTGYLVILAIIFSLLEPQGLGWTLVTGGTGLAAGTATFLLVKRADDTASPNFSPRTRYAHADGNRRVLFDILRVFIKR